MLSRVNLEMVAWVSKSSQSSAWYREEVEDILQSINPYSSQALFAYTANQSYRYKED